MGQKKKKNYKKNIESSKPVLELSQKKNLNYLKIILLILPFMYGLFYEYASSFSGGILSIYLVFLIFRRKEFVFTKNMTAYLLFFVFFSYFLVAFWAVDSGMAVIGFIKFSPCLVFMLILMQLSKDEIKECLSVIPYSGIVMVILSAPTILFPNMGEFFYDAGRLGGFFQYANTFGLFLLIGAMILLNKGGIKIKETIYITILLFGIALTGGRTTYFLTIAVFIFFFFYKKDKKEIRKLLLILAGGFVGIGILYCLITGNLSNIGRILTLFTDSSTFIGRFLYFSDSLGLIVKNPMGIGYMGFYYLQPQIQTGVYSIRFVHNEFLQMAMDAGILAALAFIVVCFRSLFSKGNSGLQKLILSVILVHSLFDFNLQFVSIFLILLMTLDFGENKIEISLKLRKLVSIGILLWGGMSLYFSLGLYMVRLGQNDLAVRMLPFNTEAKIESLKEAKSLEKIEKLSQEIIRKNPHISLAYEGKAFVAFQKKDFDAVVENQNKVIAIEAYEVDKYEAYLEILEKMINESNEKGDAKGLLKHSEMALTLPEKLKSIEEKTSPLAYMIFDQPVLDLSERSMDYLEELEKSIKRIKN